MPAQQDTCSTTMKFEEVRFDELCILKKNTVNNLQAVYEDDRCVD